MKTPPPVLSDLTGQTFGALTVVERLEDLAVKNGKKYSDGRPKTSRRHIWLCLCGCGKKTRVLQSNLLNGNSSSCGCHGHLSQMLAGQTFGMLTIIEQALGKIKKQHGREWVCKCACGKIAIVTTFSLKWGKTQSCGCIRRENWTEKALPPGEAAFRSRLNGVKKGATSRDLQFLLTDAQCRFLLTENCHYCGATPTTVYKSDAKSFDTGSFIAGGVDRMNPEDPYVIENCVPACRLCNCGKYTQTKPEFLEWIKKVYTRWYDENGCLKNHDIDISGIDTDPRLSICNGYLSKLSETDARNIFRRVMSGETRLALSREYSVTASTVGNIINGVTWKHLGLLKAPKHNEQYTENPDFKNNLWVNKPYFNALQPDIQRNTAFGGNELVPADSA